MLNDFDVSAISNNQTLKICGLKDAIIISS